MDLTYIIRLIRKHIWLLLSLPAIAGAATVFFTLNMKRSYKSEATIATNFTTGDPVSIDGDRANYFESTVSFVNAIETMTSPMVLDLVSYQLLLHDFKPKLIPFRTPEIPDIISADTARLGGILTAKLANFENLNPLLRDEKAILDLLKARSYDSRSLLKSLTVSRVNNSDFIKVSCATEDPLLTAFVVNQVADQFIRFHNNMRVNNSSESLHFFSTLLQEKELALQKRVERLNLFKLENNIVDLTAESQSKIALITQLEQSKSTTIAQLNAIQIELQRINSDLARNNGSTSSPDGSSVTEKRIQDLRAELKKLNIQYVNGGSSDAKLDEKMKQINHEIAVEENKLSAFTVASGVPTAELQTRKRELELNEKVLKGKLDQEQEAINLQRQSITSSVGKDAEFANLQADVNIASDEYKAVQEKYNRARSQALVVEKTGIRKIVSGQPADEPEPSKRMMLVLLSVGASLTLCVCYIFVSDLLNTKVKVPPLLERETQVKNVGMLNALNTEIKNLPSLLLSRTSSEKSATDVYIFRQLLNRVRFEVEQSKAKVVMVTSTREQVGKSYMIVGLAHSLSLINKRVLIIDTNFKNNALTRLFIKTKNTHLLKQDNLAEDDNVPGKSIVTPTFHSKIDIIGNDGGDFSPLEIFKGGDFGKFLEMVGSQYDYILLEGAALNAYSDSYELCQYVDKVIAVFSAQSEISDSDKDSLKMVSGLNGKLIGTVLNKVAVTDIS